MPAPAQILVLNYHRIAEHSGDRLKDNGDLYVVGSQAFRAQLEILKELDIPVVASDALTAPEKLPPFSVCITIDDGYSSDFEFTCPLLESMQFPAAIFPITDFVGKAGRMSWSEIASLGQRNFRIGSHSLSHQAMTLLDQSKQQEELQASRSMIADKTGCPVDAFSFPYGRYNRHLLSLAKEAGYSLSFGTDYRVNNCAPGTFLFHRWNIRRDVSELIFRERLEQKGKLPAGLMLAQTVKSAASRMLGYRIVNRLNQLRRR